MKKIWENSAEEFRHGSFSERCNLLAFGLLCLFIMECSITGGGRYWSVGPLNVRMILGGLALLLALPTLLGHLGKYLKNPVIYLTIAFIVWLAFSAWRGWRAGNRMDVLLSDLKGFAWLVLIPVFVAVVRSRRRLHVLMSWMVAGALVQAVCILVTNAAIILVDDPTPLRLWLSESVGLIDIVSEKLVRVFFKSSPYMIGACAVVLFRQAQAPKLRLKYVAAMALLFDALLLSYTRSLYGGIGLTAIITLIVVLCLYPASRKRVAAFVLAAVVCFGVLDMAQEVVFEGSYLSFAISRTIGKPVQPSWASQVRQLIREKNSHGSGEGTDQDDMERQRSYIETTQRSDNLRKVTKDEMRALICQNPVIGCGLGASAPSREDGIDEYFYLDMLARTGVVGLALYLLPFAYVVFWCLRKRAILMEFPEGAAVLCALCAFWIVTGFNPWMNAVLGIAWYAAAAAVPTALVEETPAAAKAGGDGSADDGE